MEKKARIRVDKNYRSNGKEALIIELYDNEYDCYSLMTAFYIEKLNTAESISHLFEDVKSLQRNNYEIQIKL